MSARQKILDAANTGRVSATPYRMNHIHQAVQRVRNRRLVKDEVLREAGFRIMGPNARVKKAVEAAPVVPATRRKRVTR